MVMERMKMKKTREILRLHFDGHLSNQQIADAVKKSKGRGSIGDVLNF